MAESHPTPLGDAFAPALERAKAGDQDAWRALYHSVAIRVRGYLRSQGATDPDDLLGEVFLQLARGLSRFEGTESNFRSWVFMIARNRLVDERRRRSRRPVQELTDEALLDLPASAGTESDGLAAVALDDLEALLAGVTAEQRHVLVLRFVADLGLEETAAVVAKPVGAVKALQRRGLAALRREHGVEHLLAQLQA